MPTVNIINSTLFALYTGTSGSEVKIANSTNTELTINQELRETTTKDSQGWKDNLEALRNFTGSGEFFVEIGVANGANELQNSIDNRTTLTAYWSTEVTGDLFWRGTVYLTSLSISAGVEDNVTASISFEGTGAITKNTVS